MKYAILISFLFTNIFANDYYAKVEPINTYNIKSSLSGKVIYTNENSEAREVKNEIIVQIDDNINKIELKNAKIKKQSLQKMLKINEQTLKSYNKVSSTSKITKDKQEITILNNKINISDLDVRIKTLEDMIKNKTLKENNRYISNINVKKGDFVNPGTLLYTAQDLSAAKLEIFVSFDDIEKIKNKTIFINDKKSNLKINKIYKTADNIHISAYKVEIILKDINKFSSLVKISFK